MPIRDARVRLLTWILWNMKTGRVAKTKSVTILMAVGGTVSKPLLLEQNVGLAAVEFANG